MDKFVQHYVELAANAIVSMENDLQHLKEYVLVLLGYFGEEFSRCKSNECSDTALALSFGNESQKIIPAQKSIDKIIKEITEMLIELKIKGSIREHRKGLLKFHNTAFGSIYGRTKEDIEKQIKEKIKQLGKQNGDNKTNKNKSPLLSEFYKEDYIPHKKHQNLKEGSIVEIDGMFRFIMSQNFDKPLTSYKAKMIEDFLYSVPQTRKRQKLQGLFNNMFKRALALSLIKVNPCTPLDKVQHIQKQGSAFSFEEQKQFFSMLFNNTELTYEQKCYFAILYLTGARRNEALYIEVKDVDFDNKILSIRGTKTKGSNRQIPLVPIVERILISLNVKSGNYFNISEDNVYHLFRKVWEKKKGHKPHDLRHTFGTIQISVEKIDVKTVSLWMGHSTLDTTVGIYTHPEQLDKATFLRGSLTEGEKNAIYREKYCNILRLIDDFIV